MMILKFKDFVFVHFVKITIFLVILPVKTFKDDCSNVWDMNVKFDGHNWSLEYPQN